MHKNSQGALMWVINPNRQLGAASAIGHGRNCPVCAYVGLWHNPDLRSAAFEGLLLYRGFGQALSG
jgi:hypothetical protein